MLDATTPGSFSAQPFRITSNRYGFAESDGGTLASAGVTRTPTSTITLNLEFCTTLITSSAFKNPILSLSATVMVLQG